MEILIGANIKLWENIIQNHDLIAVPYLFLLVAIALILRKNYTAYLPPTKKYFIPAFSLRILGAILSALMYQYYYTHGDTFVYYSGTLTFFDILSDSPQLALKTLWDSPDNYSQTGWNYFAERYTKWYMGSPASALVVKVGFLLSLICFKSYLAISFVLAFFSFLGCWKIYEVFYRIYPQHYKHLAYATLFFPSLFFWGSAGLMKDTICLAASGYLFNAFYFLFVEKKRVFLSVFNGMISLYLLYIIKPYIIILLLPSIALWVILKRFLVIKSKIVKRLAFPVFISIILIITPFVFIKLANSSSQFKLESVALRIKHMQMDFTNQKGSTFSLGDYDPSLQGILLLAPKAVNASLFRPYLWESKSLIVFFCSLESTILLFLTIYVLLKTRVFGNRVILFPFYCTALILILKERKRSKRRKCKPSIKELST